MSKWLAVVAIAPFLAFAPLASAIAATGNTTTVSPAAPSSAGVVAACTSNNAAACKAALVAYKQALKDAGLSPADADKQLVALVVVLATGVEKLPADVQAVVAQAVADISTSVSNPTQAAAIAQISTTIASGQTLQASSIQQLGASPN